MPRKPALRSSDDLAREIERLQEKRAEVEAVEHARRGKLLRQLLDGPGGDALREVLDPLVTGADRQLFGLSPSPARARTTGGAPRAAAVLTAASRAEAAT